LPSSHAKNCIGSPKNTREIAEILIQLAKKLHEAKRKAGNAGNFACSSGKVV
jgi:hypothetical protein